MCSINCSICGKKDPVYSCNWCSKCLCIGCFDATILKTEKFPFYKDKVDGVIYFVTRFGYRYPVNCGICELLASQ